MFFRVEIQFIDRCPREPGRCEPINRGLYREVDIRKGKGTVNRVVIMYITASILIHRHIRITRVMISMRQYGSSYQG